RGGGVGGGIVGLAAVAEARRPARNEYTHFELIAGRGQRLRHPQELGRQHRQDRGVVLGGGGRVVGHAGRVHQRRDRAQIAPGRIQRGSRRSRRVPLRVGAAPGSLGDGGQ